MLNRQTKTLLMFIPLVVLFVLIAIVSLDLKNPNISRYNCQVLATGAEASRLKTLNNVLYESSGNVVNDIALTCQTLGKVVINDFDASRFGIDSGDTATLTRKRYQHLPTRWHAEVNLGRQKP